MKYVVSITLLALVSECLWAENPVEFSRDILPILSANCFSCHGPDEHERQADLRLDREDDAKRSQRGKAAVVAGNVHESELIARITSRDPSTVMPPPDANRQLDPAQIDLLKRWIVEGASWQGHWSFEPVVRPLGNLDDQVSRALLAVGLEMRPAAESHVLIRRLSLDLIGLPPTIEAADRFAQDPSPDAYEWIVDALMSSPQFGEHWARMWLDLARYADTKGYEKDLGRTMWPYRDWVIDAFNSDMPLDRFTIEQLAGDLLPNATEEQLIATAFHRNTMSNDEGGTDNEEFRAIAVKDRVDSTVQIWMGLTMGCAKCHSHKYDPISQEDYYRFYALFNQTEDADRNDDEPRLPLMDEKQRETWNELTSRIDALQQSSTAADTDTSSLAQLKSELSNLRTQRTELDASIVKLPVLRELPLDSRRQTHIHRRGNFLDLGEAVTPSVPTLFASTSADAVVDRLGMARWLTAQENPLTARVWTNRIWARLFGRGIVETEEDFGALGAPPSNPQLLDWLAAEYRAAGWSLKRLLKVIVLSDTYRQSSDFAASWRQVDPENRLNSAGARYRLGAEVMRDQALFVSGLLSFKSGGPSVMPPQPSGLWRSTYNGQKWLDAEGEDRYRRGLYTYLKRTTPYPSLTIFDGGSGEVCQIRRIRTNTPLQALVVLNDPVYLEAAGALAKRIMAHPGDVSSRARYGLRLALIRPVSDQEVDPLVRLFRDARTAFEESPGAAAELIAASRSTAAGGSPNECAAWILAASTILNLDEFLVRN